MQNAHSVAVRSVRFTFLAYKKVKHNNKMKHAKAAAITHTHTHWHARTQMHLVPPLRMAAIEVDCAANCAVGSAAGEYKSIKSLRTRVY